MTQISSMIRIPLRVQRCASILAAVLVLAAVPAGAWVELDDSVDRLGENSALVTDGSYVMNVGELQVNITNFGLIGSWYSSATTFSDAPSAQWPAGSGDEYLWAAGLWVGGVMLGERLVSTGQYDREIRAQSEVEDTIYEAIAGVLVRPTGNLDASGRRYPEPSPNDDEDTDDLGMERIDEETLNGYDDDDDGLIDEDFAQIGNQMMVTTMYDNTRLASETYPDHSPLNLRIVQESFAWENDQVDDFIGFQYTISNIGVTDINNVYIGFFADSDIGPRSLGGTANDDMAGSFSGAVRASDGSWVPVEVGFMWDAAEEDRIEGYFGIAFLGHDTDPTGERAPESVRLRTFQRFSGTASFEDGGDPINDGQRYELLSANADQRDKDVPANKQDDYRFLISAGPFKIMEPEGQLQFQAAMVMGPGRDGLLRNCAEAAVTWYGNFFDLVQDQVAANNDGIVIETGVLGRESILCREDFADPSDFDRIYPDFGDVTCVDPTYLLNEGDLVNEDDMFVYTDPTDNEVKHCAMVNMDNCFECFRQKPHAVNELPENAYCSGDDIQNYWRCNDPQATDADRAGCTGVDGNETQIHWLVGMAPPPPGMRLWPTDSEVHVYWDNESETAKDIRLGEIDFESYRIWRADNWTRPDGASLENGPGSNLWQLVAEYDVVDSFIVDFVVDVGETVSHTLPLGQNTGLESIRYRPVSLDDPQFADLADSMQRVVDGDPMGTYPARPPIYGATGDPLPLSMPIAEWAGYPDVLDTFWAVTSREEAFEIDPATGEEVQVAVAKASRQYYEFVDPAVHNGFIYFYSVTATDHEMELMPDGTFRIGGEGLSGDPSSSFENSSPGTNSQTAEDRGRNEANIFVYPNPATRAALGEFQELSPDSDDPTGVRVNFANLPEAHNTIEIFTVSGDLVETIEHDGTTGFGEASWNLISRNGQEIVSGIYLYVVQSDDSGFDDFIGKFVVVR